MGSSRKSPAYPKGADNPVESGKVTSSGATIFSDRFKFLFFLFVLFSSPLLQADSSPLKIIEDLTKNGSREFGSENDRQAAEYILHEFQSYGISRVAIQLFISNGKQGHNVIAVLPGTNTSHQIILGAHHDSVAGAPGAYDDGGGVSVLLGVASHFSKMQPAYTLVFCSFDGEEQGMLGSTQFAKRLSTEQRKQTLFMLCLEMMGWEKGYPNIQTFKYERTRRQTIQPTLTPYSLASLIAKSAKKANVDLAIGDPFLSFLYQPVIRIVKVRFYGDDISFLLSGIPAVMFTDSSFSAFYPAYHQPDDRLQNINEQRLLQMTRLITTVIHQAKAQSFRQPLTSTQEQEYWIIGPLRLNYFILLVLFILLQSSLFCHSLLRGQNQLRFVLMVLTEILLSAFLFHLFPTFIFYLLGLSTFFYLLLEFLHIPHRSRFLLIYLPHLLLIIFIATAASERYLYGTYLQPFTMALLLLIVILSYLRIRRYFEVGVDQAGFGTASSKPS